jgi:chloramphenicol 3-O phosphotransferase
MYKCNFYTMDHGAPAPGHIIFLNGTSSAGKTTLARALQDALSEPFLRVGIDDFFGMVPGRFVGAHPPADQMFEIVVPDGNDRLPYWRIGPWGHRMIAGMHRTIAALSLTGNNVVVDTVLWVDGWLADAAEALRGLPVLAVQVYVPLEVAEQREMARGDRTPGTARDGYDVVYAPAPYDLRLDTSQLSTAQCVERILSALRARSLPAAFAQQCATSRPPQETEVR